MRFARLILLAGRSLLALGLGLSLAACGSPDPAPRLVAPVPGSAAGASPELLRMIERSAAEHGVPVTLVHRVVQRESKYNPGARNGPYWGLMQIMPETARTMGHRGPASELLNPEVNLRYAVKYLRGAWLVSDGSEDRAVMWYSRGYYYEAKRRGLLHETGLRS